MARNSPGETTATPHLWSPWPTYPAIYFFLTQSQWVCRQGSRVFVPAHYREDSVDTSGPWPIYLIGGAALALAMFALLWLPVRRQTA